MAPQTDPAVPTRLHTIQAHPADAFLRRKLRVAGRMLSYDVQTGLVLLCDRDIALLVDVSDCLDPYARGSSGRWIREAKSNIVVVGYLESTMEEQIVPLLPAYTSAPWVDANTVLRALLVVPAADLDLNLWNSGIEARENAGLGSASS